MDDSWASETRRVFPNIKPGLITDRTRASVAVGQPGSAQQAISISPAKLTTFTFADPPDGNCNDSVLAEVREDMNRHETILDLLKDYSEELMGDFDNRSP